MALQASVPRRVNFELQEIRTACFSESEYISGERAHATVILEIAEFRFCECVNIKSKMQSQTPLTIWRYDL